MDAQEAYYHSGIDYRRGSPHLTHLALHDRLVEVLRATVRRLAEQGLPLRVLEIGAGHGGFTMQTLALGCDVTAVDMSRLSIEELQRRFGMNPRLQVLYDPDGKLRDIDRDYTLLMFVSVLHHIPDYIAFLREASERIVRGGALITLQDPAWYSRHRAAHRAERAAYFAWRLGQGSPIEGLQTRLRRMRGTFDETNPRDMVEYHVVRNGVDEEAVLSFARGAFAEAKLIPYWSSQLGIAQRLGERLGLHNSFGVVAHGYNSNLSWRGEGLCSAPAAYALLSGCDRKLSRYCAVLDVGANRRPSPRGSLRPQPGSAGYKLGMGQERPRSHA
jgi:SAM-dependent methyltransferase